MREWRLPAIEDTIPCHIHTFSPVINHDCRRKIKVYVRKWEWKQVEADTTPDPIPPNTHKSNIRFIKKMKGAPKKCESLQITNRNLTLRKCFEFFWIWRNYLVSTLKLVFSESFRQIWGQTHILTDKLKYIIPCLPMAGSKKCVYPKFDHYIWGLGVSQSSKSLR